MCHSNRTLSVTKGGQTKSLYVDKMRFERSIHGSMGCPDCHRGLDPGRMPHAKAIKPVDCRGCHPVAGFEKSIHAAFVQCSACHGTHEIQPAGDPKSAVSKTGVSATCGQCHGDELKKLTASAHGGVLKSKESLSPNCVRCHGAHNVLPVDKKTVATLCLKCHLENSEIKKQVGYSAAFMAGYQKSVHGKALASGNLKAATCSDCHGSHDPKKASNPSSAVNKQNIAQTCSHCHSEVTAVYQESIHGVATRKGNMDAPTCTSCHGEHEILAPKDPQSRVAPRNVSIQVCADCHNSVQLSQKYGMPSQQFNSFQDSYHGLAARAGSVEVANCASCHGFHNIKPSSDPRSTVNKANLAVTCGRCHPGAGKNFARGAVHVVINRESGPGVLYWIRILYIVLIVAVVGGMFLHNLLDFIKRTGHRFAMREGKIAPEHTGSRHFVRMTFNARMQHAATLISFIILAVTGFMLKYPDAWWVIPFRQMSNKFFMIRSLLHRIAGAVLIAVSIWHLLYIFTRQGRQFVRDIFPKPKDVKDVWDNVRYLTGLSKDRPRFDRFGYPEKAEYWALIWGVIIMGGTGIVMWFDNYFIGLFTKLGWDISRTIHFYEAILATLAIIVWHFYFVMLNPAVYPMSTTWLTGEISEDEMAEEHPLELERIQSQPQPDKT